MIKYSIPVQWLKYDFAAIANLLVEVKSSIQALQNMPYQRDWVESLQRLELKREVAGTSQIEGAVFTERELDEAMKESPEQLVTRSQKQAHAAVTAYRWIAQIPDDRPVYEDLVCEMHRHFVVGADDDHCPPGVLRSHDQNVLFGSPRHRGAEGGEECGEAFHGMIRALNGEFRDHDPLVQALALHYHFAAIHPFLDGNGRTARGLEALLLQRAGLRDTCFIAMSNYYYEEKNSYLNTLAKTRAQNHDLTHFLKFGLVGLKIQVQRLLASIRFSISKELYRGMALKLFGRLQTKRQRIIAGRQLAIIELLLEIAPDGMFLKSLEQKTLSHYNILKAPAKALGFDLVRLLELGAIAIIPCKSRERDDLKIRVDLEWPEKISEEESFKKLRDLPKSKSFSFLH